MSDINEILEEREKTHGSFQRHAEVTQQMKKIMSPYMLPLNKAQKEAIEMIFHKIGRIAAGDPNHHDHWDDIAGYATLARQSIDKA